MDDGGRRASVRPALGVRATRLLGLVFTISTLLNLVVPNATRLDRYGVVAVLLAATAVAFFLLDRGCALIWAGAVYVLSLAALASFLVPGSQVDDVSTLAVVTNIATLIVPSLWLLQADVPQLRLLVLPAYLPVLVLAVLAEWSSGRVVVIIATLGCYWIVFVLMGMWLEHSVERATVGLRRLGRAHLAERRSSELEARRRYGARMLHDTVLSTLTLIAHSGHGVAPGDLRERARTDSEMLRRLRIGVHSETSAPLADDPAGPGSPDIVAELQALDRRHAQAGLRVLWHGQHGIDFAAPGVETLLLAVSECLENVRRHSGVMEADVTFTQHGKILRAAVTDEGVGFVPSAVVAGRLGLAQSVQARLVVMNGASRVFSLPGRGTTVLLEIPQGAT